MFELIVDMDESDRNFEKTKSNYPIDEEYGLGTYRQPLIISIKDIYDGMMEGTWEGKHPQMPIIKGHNSFINKQSIRKTKGIFTPKVLLFLADELDSFGSVYISKQGGFNNVMYDM